MTADHSTQTDDNGPEPDPAIRELARRWSQACEHTRFLVAVAGAVGVGKTTTAAQLAAALTALGRSCTVISTDGFLLPNNVLEDRSLLLRKGYPESYDTAALADFAGRVRSGATELDVPTYSHERFDVGDPVRRKLGDVIVFEGVNALQEPLARLVDERIFLHTDEPIVRSWFIDRMLQMITAAEHDPASFYAQFCDLDVAARRAFAVSVWEGINLPNLEVHIAPSAANADLVLRLNADHRVVEVLPGEPAHG